ncbi:Oidioi.mRNA.OKI2018_I69.PAR.g9957.t1.cds [Oikopleura dioica]|uniref:Oidioi.mRNA.OKI2018_I69.PAR.g9957.t1.cds n=1 Tax=Oikopleura dioica TaxID=34765 RepID=A0ABN7RP42_OIKDI|nr:Oidioi.mRNA.OKI2018_I69.PAR.g9957.t1.cds [Oikopleura dioica]
MKWKLAFLTLGIEARRHEKGERWALKQQRIQLKYEANVNHNIDSGGGEERSADEACKNACRDVISVAAKNGLIKAVDKCTDSVDFVKKLKHKKPETIATNGVLMFDDDFANDSSPRQTTALTDSGKSKSPVNRGPGRPQSESKGTMSFGDLPDELLLFSDDMEDFGEPELMPERMISPQFEAPKKSGKRNKRKKGKKGRSG